MLDGVTSSRKRVETRDTVVIRFAGESAFQLSFSSNEVFTPGDDLDVLVAMNPAALKMNVGDLNPGGILIVDREGFNQQKLQKAEYASNPLEDGSLQRY